MKKFIFIIVSIILLLVSVFLIVWLPKSDLEKYIIINNACYSEKWKLTHTNVDSENQTLSIRFDKKRGGWNDNIDNIYEIYKWLCKKIYENDNFRKYSVNIDFLGIGEYFSIRNITYDSNRLEIWCNTAVRLKNISAMFSDAKKLYLFPAVYNDISEIEGFSNLQYIYFSQKITDDEIMTVKSYFPDCRFECGDY